ncbi:protein saal1 isoform X2 [Myripristis murdjan]|uniref:Serum amyloid A-like 1 n=1 Tax=Myripristis murdjan TaxID=586833 RepID=A0A667ZT75_9TELE|nr:protein SAAL1 isoform X2 [Myripristis murdjan]
MERTDGGDETSSSPEKRSPVLDRNPSPPPDTADGQEEEDLDAIGETVYSKHWVFSTLTRLIQMVSEHTEEDADGQMQLADDEEEDLCRVWDMAMDKDVAGFLQEFKAADILLGVIAKSRCPRLTEICVGILGNIACFPETCLTLSQNENLGAVLLLLLGDTDPPTLLETSRLLLTCVSQKDVCSLWLQRIRQQTSLRYNLCFIMCSSTNLDLLVKVGELVDKLFDLDEELMKSWITAQPSEEDDGESRLDVASSLLEAAKQLRSDSQDGLEVYVHALQLLTTIDEGIQTLAAPDGSGKAVWDFLCEVVCEDLCQPDDPPLVLQEQKVLLVQAFAVLSALYQCQEQWHSRSDTYLPLIGTVLRVLQYHSEYQSDKTEGCDGKGDTQSEETKDEQLQALVETTAEFLADIFFQIPKDSVAELVRKGYLTEKTCFSAAVGLLPQFKSAFQHLESMLSEIDPQLADMLRKQLPA